MLLVPTMLDHQRRQLISRHDAHKQKRSGRIHCTEDARVVARRRMPRMMFDFVDGSAGNEVGERLNRTAIERIRLQPRVLVNVENRNLGKRFLGRDMGLPFGIAPMGMCDLTWPGADRMLAAEAVHREMPLCVSSAASTTLEDMYARTNGRAWFQLYVGQSLESAMQMVDRAAAAGYGVLVLTVDVPQVSRRIRDLRNGFQVPFPQTGSEAVPGFCLPSAMVHRNAGLRRSEADEFRNREGRPRLRAR